MIPWLSWPRALGGLVMAVCVAWLGFVLKTWHDAHQALPGVEAARDAAIAETARVRKDMAAESARLAKVNEELADENETLRVVRDATPVRSVRLCLPAGEGRALPADPAAAGRGDGAASAGGVLPAEDGRDPQPGPDIGPDIYALMDEADEYMRLYRGAQAYIRGLPAACRTEP